MASKDSNKKEQDEHHYLNWAHPLVKEWFLKQFGSATEPQELGWGHIVAGKNTLICAPTGSGKTLAAFLACINQLVSKAVAGNLEDKTEVLYISPLKALSNDIQKNLEKPLAEIRELASDKGINIQEIRTAVRTGDTLASERQKILKKPPHILVTTPESLYILLTAEKSRQLLKSVETIIVDEIHAVADDKRGAHLAISLERLEKLCSKKLKRIGLSATQKPIELVGKFLVGTNNNAPEIVNVGHARKLDLAVEVPGSPLDSVASNAHWEEVFDRIVQLSGEHRSTLVFVNTRKQAERVTMNLAIRMGEDAVATHHGSLSRKLRLEAERKLKNGEIKVLVATASLELGIDIGFVELVCQISSPRAIATALQRIGRAGHWRGAIPKGKLFALTLDELIESAALVKAIKSGDLEELFIPEIPLDILAQQIVAMCAAEEWSEDTLFRTIKRAYPYRDLSKDIFKSIISMLADGISARRGRYGAYLLHDKVNKKLKARRGARLAAITSGGAIPESNLYQVVAEPDGIVVGTLDEDFAVESNIGDIILLGNTSWRVRRVHSNAAKVSVEDAHGAAPTVPFWLGEAPARSYELSHNVSELRKIVSDKTKELESDFLTRAKTKESQEAINWLKENCYVDDAGAEQIIEYIVRGRAVLGEIPSEKLVIAERFFDEGGGMQLVIHAPFGGRINKAWGLALRKIFCRTFNFELQASATDNGLIISLGEQHSFPLADVFYYLTKDSYRHALEQASLASPIFATRFRWDATRSLALLRFMGGKKVPPNLMRLRADDLLAAVFPQAAACQDNQPGDVELPDHPLINEVMKDVLTEAMDMEGLGKILTDIGDGKIQCLAVDTPVPSVFSHEIINANPYAYLDDAPIEERRAHAVEMRRVLPEAVVKEIGRLDNNAVEKVKEEAWPDIRDADELHDFLQTIWSMPEELYVLAHESPKSKWYAFFEELQSENRILIAQLEDDGHNPMPVKFWVAAERAKNFKAIYTSAKFDRPIPELDLPGIPYEEGLVSLMQGWMMHLGPMSVKELETLLHLPKSAIELALLKLEASGAVLRGQYTSDFAPAGEPSSVESWQWCDRRLLARIHRMTVTTLRKQVEPVTAGLFLRWLTSWQHLAPGTQLTGERGTLEVLRQLQGFEIPANAWEREILSKRIINYDPADLDRLCLTGMVGWGRLSPHPALIAKADKSARMSNSKGKKEEDDLATEEELSLKGNIRRVIPTSVAPITFFVRSDADWMPHHDLQIDDRSRVISHAAKVVKNFLKERGASFFQDIVRSVNLLKSEVESALWELVTAGVVTADGFDNLRALIDPKRRAGSVRTKVRRPRDSVGRWSLLYSDAISERNKMVEAICWMLLHRYGVVFRDILTRESNLPKWRELQNMLRLMEDRGVIRGGRFVNGFLGEQFALPEAIESLRSFRKQPARDYNLKVSAADPLNLIGIIIPGERTPALSGKMIELSSDPSKIAS